MLGLFICFYMKIIYFFMSIFADRRQDALNTTTEIVAIGLNGQNIQGEIS